MPTVPNIRNCTSMPIRAGEANCRTGGWKPGGEAKQKCVHGPAQYQKLVGRTIKPDGLDPVAHVAPHNPLVFPARLGQATSHRGWDGAQAKRRWGGGSSGQCNGVDLYRVGSGADLTVR